MVLALLSGQIIHDETTSSLLAALCKTMIVGNVGDWLFSFESKQKNMDQKIQLTHPAGKKAVSIDKRKYDTLKKAIINYLNTKGESTHAEILQAINEDFKKNQTRFEGSVNWHLEWVILDLEAIKEIKRTSNKSPIKFTIARRDTKLNA